MQAVPPLIPGSQTFTTLLDVTQFTTGELLCDSITTNLFVVDDAIYSTPLTVTGNVTITGTISAAKTVTVGSVSANSATATTISNGLYSISGSSIIGITTINGLSNPINSLDAANKAYVDSTGASIGAPNRAIQFNNLGSFGGSASLEWTSTPVLSTTALSNGSNLITGNSIQNIPLITGLSLPINPTDAASKAYVDSLGTGGAAGPNMAIQFNLAGSMGGSANLLYNPNTHTTEVQGTIQTNILQSVISTGTPPFVVASTTPVTNLKAGFATNSTFATLANQVAVVPSSSLTTAYLLAIAWNGISPTATLQLISTHIIFDIVTGVLSAGSVDTSYSFGSGNFDTNVLTVPSVNPVSSFNNMDNLVLNTMNNTLYGQQSFGTNLGVMNLVTSGITITDTSLIASSGLTISPGLAIETFSIFNSPITISSTLTVNNQYYMASQPYFEFVASATQSITSSTPTELTTYWTVQRSQQSVISQFSQGIMTVSQTGLYYVTATIIWASNSTGDRIAYFLVNESNANYYAYTQVPSTSDETTVQIVSYVSLSSGDKISVFVSQTSGSSLNVTNSPAGAVFSAVKFF